MSRQVQPWPWWRLRLRAGRLTVTLVALLLVAPPAESQGHPHASLPAMLPARATQQRLWPVPATAITMWLAPAPA
jgi:hypothetical protein